MDTLAKLFVFYISSMRQNLIASALLFPPPLPISFNFLKSKRCGAYIWKWGGKQTKSTLLDPELKISSKSSQEVCADIDDVILVK